MTFQIMLAVRPEDQDALSKIIERGDYSLVVANSVPDAKQTRNASQFHVAIIDEDFDGKGSGWKLAQQLRTQSIAIKVIVLCRNKNAARQYFSDEKYAALFDWLLPFPISGEQLLGEIERRLTL